MLYTHDPRHCVPYLAPIKTFGDLKDGDTVFILNLESFAIEEKAVSNVKFEHHEEHDYYSMTDNEKMSVYKYKTVHFDVDEFRTVNVYYHTETNVLVRKYDDNDWHYVICTTKREVEQLVKILAAKCENQMNQFKRIFNGSGWNYAERNVVLG